MRDVDRFGSLGPIDINARIDIREEMDDEAKTAL